MALYQEYTLFFILQVTRYKLCLPCNMPLLHPFHNQERQGSSDTPSMYMRCAGVNNIGAFSKAGPFHTLYTVETSAKLTYRRTSTVPLKHEQPR